jgi:aspartate kinase
MTVVVGRVRPCPVLTLRLVVLSHNMVRGAAGGCDVERGMARVAGPPPPEIARVIVMKFGGTSVADAARILAAAEIVRSRLARRPVVVVSALAGVTDLLVRASAVARDGTPEDLDPILADLARRHRWALSGSVSHPGRRHDLGLEVDALLEELRQLLRSIRVLGEGTPRAGDALLAFGEILSSRIVAAAFAEQGLPVAQVDARRVMITDARHGAAEPDLDEVAARGAEVISPRLAAGEVPVLGGFFGAAKTAGPRPSAAGGRIRPRPCWDRRSTPRRSRSGPMWTGS